MILTEKINDDIKTAMKNKDKESLNVLRMVKGAIQLAKVDCQHDLTDEEVIDIVSKQIKMRKDSIQEFTKASRTDLIDQYRREIEILEKYLPKQLTNEEVDKLIDEAIKEINPTSAKEMGLVMKKLTPQVKGRFDMSLVSQKVKEKLN